MYEDYLTIVLPNLISGADNVIALCLDKDGDLVIEVGGNRVTVDKTELKAAIKYLEQHQ